VLAGNFAHEHPVLNTVLGAAVVLLIAGLVVFAKPVGRLLDRLNLKLLQALGMANKDDDRDDPR
jgi:hypothetical protein